MHPKTVAKTFLPLSVAWADAVPDRSREAMPLRSGAPSRYRHVMNKLNATRLRANDFLEDIFLWKKCRNATGRDIDGSAEGLPIARVVQAMGRAAEFRLGLPSAFGGHRE
ncbi:hypothetical protein [Burkholderia aenigmatica]|uniref:hypothetical protein n=1 Tax=Burkholderia aenigmatica TaxID=2015348 RepID=UPI00264F5211|nr:hypothetical protein [Burkholderia aenigmatica]MDN7873823.1 hypothetical protein [Burkholderia aenigmatica]